MTYKEIISLVAKEVNLPELVVDKTYQSMWLIIKDIIEEMPLKLLLDKLWFIDNKTSFNLPSLGKLACTFDRMTGVKKRQSYLNNLK